MEDFVLPPRKPLADFLDEEPAKSVFSTKVERSSPHKKGKCWSEEEHLGFLEGLRKLGKGNWRGISRYYVPTRTSTQIASHAQKYAQRVSGATKRTSKFTKIEQQAMKGTAEESNPSAEQPRNPSPADMQSFSAPAGSGSESPAGSEGVREEEGLRKRARNVDVCRPMALRASESEPDLMKLAEELISLADPGRRLSPSDSSAFTPAPGFCDKKLPCSSNEKPGAAEVNITA